MQSPPQQFASKRDSLPAISVSHYQKWQPTLKMIWYLHFIATLLILVYGITDGNGQRKYVSIDVEKLPIPNDCYKAFVDVFSQTQDDNGAIVCCQKISDNNSHSLCRTPPKYLVFAQRLARFPDAWLLPLFPLMVRVLYLMIQHYAGVTIPSGSQTMSIRRLYLYLGVINFRGWILYLILNGLEDGFVTPPSTSCWYHPLLSGDSNICLGTDSDFSDHVVLYFAQILPIPLIEVLHTFVSPFWSHYENKAIGGNGGLLVGLSLVVGLLYLYMITFMGAYKTSAHYHTAAELFGGYFVSLLSQVPLYLIQCTSYFPQARRYFFGYP